MRAKPPHLVLITEDCRDGSPATGKFGIYEGDRPRHIHFSPPGQHEWRSRPYSEDIIHQMQGMGMVECIKFTEAAATQLGFTLPMYGTGPEVMAAINSIHDLTEELRQSCTTGYYFTSDNPYIVLEDGSGIWGDECWWRPVDEEVYGETLEKLLETSNQEVQSFCNLLAAVAQLVETSPEVTQSGHHGNQ